MKNITCAIPVCLLTYLHYWDNLGYYRPIVLDVMMEECHGL